MSLRDIERALLCLSWFLEKDRLFFVDAGELAVVGRVSRATVLALAVCYRSALPTQRSDFDEEVAAAFADPVPLPGGWRTIRNLVKFVSQQFLDDALRVDPRIAPNEAVRENVFLMTVTSQLGIPFFNVGKPGSSKSLAKTIVAESMRGAKRGADSRLYRELKEIQMVSFQCSPMSTAEGVAGAFRQCAQRQRKRKDDLDQFAVLPLFEEIGMAEDSPQMPLKALHGLLEEGSAGLDGEDCQAWHRTGFIGISNWALDPAKMNRGIFLSRALPNRAQLLKTAEFICGKDKSPSYGKIQKFLAPLTEAYLEVYTNQEKDYEFYGLRDFYSFAFSSCLS